MRTISPKYLRHLLRCSDPTILEIGCNDGADTLGFLRVFPAATLHCFEPDPRAIACWRHDVHDPRATLYEVALWSEPGTHEFHPSSGHPPGPEYRHYTRDWDRSGSLLAWDRHVENAPWMSPLAPITVPTMRLDDWATEHPLARLDLVWMDVQGAEAHVIRGGQQTIPRAHWLVLECDSRPNYHQQATLGELTALLPGFTLHERCTQYNYLFRRTTGDQ